MRKGILVAGLAIAAVTISGCQTTDPDFDSGVSSTGGGGTTGTGTTGTGTTTGSTTTTASGSTASTSSSTFSPGDAQSGGTGDPAVTTLSDGDAGMAFNSAGQSADGGALVQVTPNGSEVRVAVDDGTNGALGWPEPITLPSYDFGTARGNTAFNFSNDIQNHSLLKGSSAATSSYEEYRKIDSTTDAELQVWNYENSYIGQYRVWAGGNSPDGQNLAVFHGGTKTDPANLPASATYSGRMGATATAANWIPFDRTAPDRDAADPASTYATDPGTGEVTTAASVDPNGEWRVTGDANMTANFGAGTLDGTFTNMVWKKYRPNPGEEADGNGYTTIYDSDEASNPFPSTYTLDATTNGADFTGTVTAEGGYVNGGSNTSGSFYGPTGQEAAGVFYNEATAPGPTDGDSPYEANRRAYVNIRGVFHGSQ